MLAMVLVYAGSSFLDQHCVITCSSLQLLRPGHP